MRKLWRGSGVNIGLSFLAVFAIGPLLWMLSVSFMSPGEASSFPPPLFPENPTLDNYIKLFEYSSMGRNFLNSLFVASAATLLSLTFNVSAGYAFAKLEFKGRHLLFRALLRALVIPAQVSMIPLFLMLKGMGLVNSWIGVLIPFVASIFGIFLVRQYALSIPTELIEAGRIDGANIFGIYRFVLFPLSVPAFVVVMIWQFTSIWNDFLFAVTITSSPDVQPITVGLNNLAGSYIVEWNVQMAAAFLTALPTLLVYIILGRYFLRGLMAGSLKG